MCLSVGNNTGICDVMTNHKKAPLNILVERALYETSINNNNILAYPAVFF